MRNKKEYLEFLLDWLSPLGTITSRGMFGGHCLYCDGVVFALVADNALYLKVDDRTRSRFELLGLQPFQPFKNKIEAQGGKYPQVMQFYQPPAEFFDDIDVMKDWGRAAVEVGRRAPAKKKKKRAV